MIDRDGIEGTDEPDMDAEDGSAEDAAPEPRAAAAHAQPGKVPQTMVRSARGGNHP